MAAGWDTKIVSTFKKSIPFKVEFISPVCKWISDSLTLRWEQTHEDALLKLWFQRGVGVWHISQAVTPRRVSAPLYM